MALQAPRDGEDRQQPHDLVDPGLDRGRADEQVQGQQPGPHEADELPGRRQSRGGQRDRPADGQAPGRRVTRRCSPGQRLRECGVGWAHRSPPVRLAEWADRAMRSMAP